MAEEKYTPEGLPIVKKDLIRSIWEVEDRDFGLPDEIPLDKIDDNVREKLAFSLADAYMRGRAEASYWNNNRVFFEELKKRVEQVGEYGFKYLLEKLSEDNGEYDESLPIKMYQGAFMDGVKECYRILRAQAEAYKLEKEVKGE